MQKDKITSLRIFFTTSKTAFDLVRNISLIMGNHFYTQSLMEVLHDMAYIEIMKENPDMDKINDYLKEMELLADQKNKLDNKTEND
jgi:hypothetical protein